MSRLRETTFTWTVDNFDVAPHLTGEWIESPTFSIDAMGNSMFSLILYPRGWQKDENYVSLFLKRHPDKADDKILLDFELRLVEVSGECSDVQRATPDELPKCIMRGNYRFCDRSQLMGPSRDSLLPGGRLTISCRMLPTQEDSESDESEDCCSPDCEVLSRDFAELLKNGVHSDLTIEARGGKELRVHKAILEARCPQLMSRLAESENSEVMVLEDVEAPALQAILHYVYTGMFERSDKLEEVFVAANRYALSDLKELMFPFSHSQRAKTVIDCYRVSFEWIIRDFTNFPCSNKEISYSLISDYIPMNNWMKVSLLAKERDDGEKSTMLKFQKLWNYYYGVVSFKVQASDRNGRLFPLKESEGLFENGKFEVPFDIDEDLAKKVVVNGNLKLEFDIRASIKSDQASLEKATLSYLRSDAPDVNRDWSTLHKDLLRFYKSMKTGDVTLSIDTEELTAHKAVLCSRSEVFCKMFEHDSLESQTNTVHVEDVDVETMTSVLMYMYCGTTDDDQDVATAVKLYSAADKYQLLPLREKCCQYLKSNVDADNVGEVLLLADAHFDEGLKKRVLKFITANASEVLKSQRGLKELEDRVDLYQDILNVLLEHVSLQEEELERARSKS